MLGDFVGGLAQCAQSLRGRWRIALANDSADLVVATAAQRLGVKGRCANEQFVEQHAQRIDVAAGVDIQRRSTSACSGLMYSGVPIIWPMLGEERLLGQPLLGRLGDAEVDDLGHRLAVVHA